MSSSFTCFCCLTCRYFDSMPTFSTHTHADRRVTSVNNCLIVEEAFFLLLYVIYFICDVIEKRKKERNITFYRVFVGFLWWVGTGQLLAFRWCDSLWKIHVATDYSYFCHEDDSKCFLLKHERWKHTEGYFLAKNKNKVQTFLSLMWPFACEVMSWASHKKYEKFIRLKHQLDYAMRIHFYGTVRNL